MRARGVRVCVCVFGVCIGGGGGVSWMGWVGGGVVGEMWSMVVRACVCVCVCMCVAATPHPHEQC